MVCETSRDEEFEKEYLSRMPIYHAIWKVGIKAAPLTEMSLGKRALLEQMIIDDLAMISDRWLLIGRKIHGTHGGRFDFTQANSILNDPY